MPKKFYFDTSIWLDFLEKRGKNGEIVFKLINKIIEENQTILYSSLIIKELKNLGYFLTEINNIFSIAKQHNLRIIHINKEQLNEMRKLALQKNIPKRDALHAVLARDNEAHLITRDYHFQKLKDIITPKLPEDFT